MRTQGLALLILALLQVDGGSFVRTYGLTGGSANNISRETSKTLANARAEIRPFVETAATINHFPGDDSIRRAWFSDNYRKRANWDDGGCNCRSIRLKNHISLTRR